MDIHPSGFPGLVGPEGGYDFSHFDFSSHFRVLPSNSAADVATPCHENLAVRSHLQPLHLQASPSNNTGPRLAQPLCIREDNGKNINNSTSRGNSPRPHHLLSDPALSRLGGSPPSRRFSHSFSAPARIAPAEVKQDAEEILTDDGFDHNGDPLVLGY